MSPRSQLTRRRTPSPISPRSVSPVYQRSRSPEAVIRASPLRRATSRGVQRGVPRSRRERTGWDLELRRWCLRRDIRQLRSTARRVLVALTVISVLVAIVLNFDWPETLLLAGSDGAAKMTCPANSVLKDDRCLATEVECPPGSSRVEGHCVALEVDCPDGSVHVGERCVVSMLHKSVHYAAAERLACSSVGVAGVYAVFVSLVGATGAVAWRNRPKPQRYRCLHDAAMTAERDFLPAHYGTMTTLATVGHIRQGEVVTVRRLDTSRPTQQRRAQLDSGYWVSLVSQQGERLFQRINEAESAAEEAATHGSAGISDDSWEEGGGRGGGISLFATFPAGVCQVRLHTQNTPSGQHRLAARRATFGAHMGNLFGATCVLPRARHAELELDPLVVASADGRRRIAAVAVVYRCDFVSCVEQARRVQAAGAAGLILVNEQEGQAPPDWRSSTLGGAVRRRVQGWPLPWVRRPDGFPGAWIHICSPRFDLRAFAR